MADSVGGLVWAKAAESERNRRRSAQIDLIKLSDSDKCCVISPAVGVDWMF
jgi:hypothetical protein